MLRTIVNNPKKIVLFIIATITITVFVVFLDQKEIIEERKIDFTSNRVQSKKLPPFAPGKRDDSWTAEAMRGYQIDYENAKFDIKRIHKCSISRTSGAWVSRTVKKIVVKVHTNSVRKSGATCKTKTTISFTEKISWLDYILLKINNIL